MRTLLALLFTFVGIVSAQSQASSWCKCKPGASSSSSDVICLGAKDMRTHVERLEPLKPSGLGKRINLAGTVVLEVAFDSDGKPFCFRAKSSHPIAVSAAMEALPKWTFKPLSVKGTPKSGCGQITIKYRLRDQGSTTELQ